MSAKLFRLVKPAVPLVVGLSLPAISGVLSIVTAFILALIFGTEQYSWVVFGVSIGSILVPILNLGSDRVLVRDLDRQECDSYRTGLVFRNLRIRLSACMVAVASLVVAGLFVDAHGKAVTLVAISIWAMIQGLYPYSIFDFVRKTSLQNSMVVAERVVALMLVLSAWNQMIPWGYVGRMSLALLATRILSLAWQYVVWKRSFGSASLSERFAGKGGDNGISVWVTLVLFSSACVGYSSQAVLGIRGASGDLAAYGLAFQAASFVLVFQSQAMRLFANEIMKASAMAIVQTGAILRAVWHMLLLSLILALGYLSATLMVDKFYGAQFPGFFLISIPLAVWTIVAGPGQLIAQYLVYLRLEREYFLINLIGGLSMVASSALLVPRFGGLGAGVLLLVIHGGMIFFQAATVWRRVVHVGQAARL